MINFYGAQLGPQRPTTPNSAPAPRPYRTRPKKRKELSKEECDRLFLACDIQLPPHVFADEQNSADQPSPALNSPTEQREHARELTRKIYAAQKEQLKRPLAVERRPRLLPAISLQARPSTSSEKGNKDSSDDNADEDGGLLAYQDSPDPSSAFRPDYGIFANPQNGFQVQVQALSQGFKTPENRPTQRSVQDLDNTQVRIGVGHIIRRRSITPLT